MTSVFAADLTTFFGPVRDHAPGEPVTGHGREILIPAGEYRPFSPRHCRRCLRERHR